MTNHQVLLTAGLAFFLGCASAPFVDALIVPPLSAQQVAVGVQRWEHQCVAIVGGRPARDAAEATELSQRMGAEGWELATMTAVVLCFKRPHH